MGVVLGLSAAALFGLSGICIKIGMRGSGANNGHFMSLITNSVLVGGAMLRVELPPWSWTGFILFIVAGVMTTLLARGSSFIAIRHIGPSRQSAVVISAPVFAASTGWLVLGETVEILQGLGAIIVTLGVVTILRTKIEDEETSAHTSIDVEQLREAGPLNVLAWREEHLDDGSFTKGFLFALIAAIFFGIGFVIRKAGLAHYESAVAGAFFGIVSALTVITMTSMARGRFHLLLKENFHHVPWWFVFSGVASGFAILAQFEALNHLAAWVVALLLGTQGVWTLLWSYMFLGEEEAIGLPLLLSMALVLIGVTIMMLAN